MPKKVLFEEFITQFEEGEIEQIEKQEEAEVIKQEVPSKIPTNPSLSKPEKEKETPKKTVIKQTKDDIVWVDENLFKNFPTQSSVFLEVMFMTHKDMIDLTNEKENVDYFIEPIQTKYGTEQVYFSAVEKIPFTFINNFTIEDRGFMKGNLTLEGDSYTLERKLMNLLKAIHHYRQDYAEKENKDTFVFLPQLRMRFGWNIDDQKEDDSIYYLSKREWLNLTLFKGIPTISYNEYGLSASFDFIATTSLNCQTITMPKKIKFSKFRESHYHNFLIEIFLYNHLPPMTEQEFAKTENGELEEIKSHYIFYRNGVKYDKYIHDEHHNVDVIKSTNMFSYRRENEEGAYEIKKDFAENQDIKVALYVPPGHDYIQNFHTYSWNGRNSRVNKIDISTYHPNYLKFNAKYFEEGTYDFFSLNNIGDLYRRVKTELQNKDPDDYEENDEMLFSNVLNFLINKLPPIKGQVTEGEKTEYEGKWLRKDVLITEENKEFYNGLFEHRVNLESADFTNAFTTRPYGSDLEDRMNLKEGETLILIYNEVDSIKITTEENELRSRNDIVKGYKYLSTQNRIVKNVNFDLGNILYQFANLDLAQEHDEEVEDGMNVNLEDINDLIEKGGFYTFNKLPGSASFLKGSINIMGECDWLSLGRGTDYDISGTTIYLDVRDKYYKPLFFSGFYIVMGTNHNFSYGEWETTLNLIGVRVEDKIVEDKEKGE